MFFSTDISHFSLSYSLIEPSRNDSFVACTYITKSLFGDSIIKILSGLENYFNFDGTKIYA